jgi:uncharacterized membrane protein
MKELILLSYFLIILGSIGMVIFATHFSFSTKISDLKHSPERFLMLNGYRVWLISWVLIIIGTFIQMLDYWMK